MQILYFQKRDKSAVEVVAMSKTFHQGFVEKMILDVGVVSDNITSENKIYLEEKFINKKMSWELFLGNFFDAEHFKKQMSHKGIKNIPPNLNPHFIITKEFKGMEVAQQKTMLQRNFA